MTRPTYLITGATKGSGRALSEQLSAQGDHVIGLARKVDDHSFPGTLRSVKLWDPKKLAG